MNALLAHPLLRAIPWRSLAVPLIVFLILAMMILPLPAFALDLLFTFNIALALIVLMVSAYTRQPLDFAAFPTVLLLTTLLRLSLNVASTRVVLTSGHTGSAAAGHVIESFGHFVVGGNFAVGLIVFAILVVINFMVVTKGAGRIAEVAARFTLDAMPGKQMAIDADLNAGLIDDKEARRRRNEVAQEADFYGAMDGASKFVRGDAIAGILILFINIIGGLAIGVLQHDLDFATAVDNYMLLTIGDGLVAQIPGAGHLDRRRPDRVARRQGRQRCRIADRLPDVRDAARAGDHRGHPVPARHHSRDAHGRLPAAGGRLRLPRLEAHQHPRARAPHRRGRRRRPACAGGRRGDLGRRHAGRRARPRGRLPPDPAGRRRCRRRTAQAHPRDPQEVRAGDRLPAAAGPYPRQPRTQAQPVPDPPQGRGHRRRRGLHRACSWPSIPAA